MATPAPVVARAVDLLNDAAEATERAAGGAAGGWTRVGPLPNEGV